MDLSDPVAAPSDLPVTAVDLPKATYTWSLLSQHSTPEQRKWAYRVVSDTNLWYVVDWKCSRNYPRLNFVGIERMYALLTRYLHVTWIVATEDDVDDRVERLKTIGEREHENGDERNLTTRNITNTVLRCRCSILTDLAYHSDSDDEPMTTDDDGSDRQAVQRRRIHVAPLTDVLLKDFSDEDTVVIDGMSAAQVAATVTVVCRNGTYNNPFHIITTNNGLDGSTDEQDMKTNVLTLLPARSFHWGSDTTLKQ